MLSQKNLGGWIGIAFVALGLGPGLFSGSSYSSQDDGAEVVYLFSYFTGNGELGLHLAWSVDGLHWQPLAGGKPLLSPQVGSRLMRDPYIVQGPEGTFYLVWTTGWKDLGFGLAQSADLIRWSEQRFIPVMEGIPGAKNCWAPEMIWDRDTEQWVIFWSSTIEGRFPETLPAGDNGWNHRIYRTTSKDLRTFGQVELFYEPGFNVIDATLAHWNGKYVMVIKNETRHPPAKNLCVAFAEKVLGPWSAASRPFSPPGVWAEGPSLLRVGNWWYIYYDRYTLGQYGVIRTKDFQSFEDITEQLRYPAGMRHGTAFAVSREIFEALKLHCDLLANHPSP